MEPHTTKPNFQATPATPATPATSGASTSSESAATSLPPEKGVSGELAQDRQTPPTRAASLWGRIADAAAGLSQRLGPNGILIIILGIGMAVFFALSVAAAEVYDAVTDEDGVAGLDRPMLDLAISLRSPWADATLTWYTNMAGTYGMPLIAIVAIIILSLRRRSWTPAILIAATGAGSLLMTVAGKLIFGRDRPALADAVPPYESSASFPSGHTLNAVAIIGIIAYLLVKRQKRRWARVITLSVATLFVITTGLTRVFLGHHWFTDVLFAWILGLAWLVAVITAHQLYLAVRARHEAASTRRESRTELR